MFSGARSIRHIGPRCISSACGNNRYGGHLSAPGPPWPHNGWRIRSGRIRKGQNVRWPTASRGADAGRCSGRGGTVEEETS